MRRRLVEALRDEGGPGSAKDRPSRRLAGSKAYLAIASLIGLVALGSGILTVANATEDTLAILVITTLVLWASATLRHSLHQRQDVALA